jgi:hypothetical protein
VLALQTFGEAKSGLQLGPKQATRFSLPCQQISLTPNPLQLSLVTVVAHHLFRLRAWALKAESDALQSRQFGSVARDGAALQVLFLFHPSRDGESQYHHVAA